MHLVQLVWSLVAIGFLSTAQAALTADEVMKRNETARQIHDIRADAQLTQEGKGKDAKTKEFTWWRKLAANGVDFKTFVRFHAPATVKGEGILMLEHDGGENEVLLYLPAYKKIRRVENQQQTGKFMGSAFSYSDIATPHRSDYRFTLKREGVCPLAEHASARCYEIEAVPVRDAVKTRTGYARTVQWVRTDNFMTVQADYFGLDQQALKRFEAYTVQNVDAKNGKWMAMRSRMTNVKTGESSLLEFSNVEVGSGTPDRVFTQQNLSAPE